MMKKILVLSAVVMSLFPGCKNNGLVVTPSVFHGILNMVKQKKN